MAQPGGYTNPAAASFTGATSQNNALNVLSRLADQARSDNPRINQPMSVTAWTVSTNYVTGAIVSANGNYYEQQAHPNGGNAYCTSAGSGGGPASATQSMIADNNCLWSPIAVTPSGNAPTLYAASTWQISTSYPANAYILNFTGSGSSAFGNVYKTSSACTSAGSGNGPNAAGAGIATFSGTVMTVTTASAAGFAAGQTISALYAAFPSGITISSLGTGTGGTGTYNLSASVPTIGTAVGVTGSAASISDNTCAWAFQKSFPSAQYSNSAANSYLWNSGGGNLSSVMNYYGGTITNDPSTHYSVINAATYNGNPLYDTASRFEFATSAATILIRAYDYTPSVSGWRFIVCDANRQGCQYVNPNPLTITAPFWNTFVMDFSSVGGRKPRIIIVENGSADLLGGFDITPFDAAWKPTAGQQPLTIAMVGDSYVLGNGVFSSGYTFGAIAADLLGARNFVDLGLGFCGYGPLWSGTASFASNQMTVQSTTAGGISIGAYVNASGVTAGTTILSGSGPYTLSTSPGTIATEAVTTDLCQSKGVQARLSDVTSLNGGAGPDILVIANGTNNVGTSTTTYTTTLEQSFITAVRAALPNIPIFVMGMWDHNNGGTSCANCAAMETALFNGLSGYSNVYSCPVTNDPAGAWETGTGSIETPNGTGNTDVFFSSTSGHPNSAWNRHAGYRLAACIRNTFSNGRF